jgi:two-component system sensor histidine kinase/response regulator
VTFAGAQDDDANRVNPPTASGVGLYVGGAAELGSSEAIFEGLSARTPLVAFVADTDGNCVHVNERWCELSGLTRAQSLGRGWADALHPDDAERVAGEWGEATGTGGDMIVDYRLLRPDGGVSWIQGFASAVRDDDGRVTCWVGSCLDVTTRRQADEIAAESSARFQVAFESAPIGVALAAPDGHWLDVNDALCELTGYDKEGLLERGFAHITHPDDQARSNEEWVRHNAGDGDDSNRLEKRYVRADGESVWVSVTRTLVRDADGEMLYSVAHIEDITGRRNAQRSLEDAEERFRRAFDDAPIGMALVGLDGSWLRANASLCEILGYNEPALVALKFHDITHPDDQEMSSYWVRGLLEGRHRTFAHEKRYIRRDGSCVWAMLSVSLARDASGVPLYMVSQIEDIDDRKLAEARMASHLELERDHVERLQALDRLKDEFVASVSHELRTPLTSIQGYLELVLDGEAGELNDEQRQYLATVSRNSERLLRLVGDLLLVAQTDAGRLDLILGDVDLATLVRESVESARPPADAKQIRLEVSVDEVPPFRGDRARLAQLIDNLVSNALKFTLEGGSVTVSLTRGDGCAVLEVQDTGIGIPEAEQDLLFDRFFRARGATSRAIQGTGLGLSIAKTIAESHGGQISFESVEEVGTTFRVELPCEEDQPGRTSNGTTTGSSSPG